MSTPRRIHQCGAVHDVAINLHPPPRAVEHYPVSFQNLRPWVTLA